MVDWGAKFVWYFHYMPVGNDAAPELLPSPEQREYMYHQIRHIRETKPIFAMDFQNDGEFVGGCIAGGRRYLHINANGDVDPCVFIHYSDSNIREKTLLEGLQSPIFMAYHDGQPFNHNHAAPLPHAGKPGPSAQDGQGDRRTLHGPAVPGDGGSSLRQVREIRRLLEAQGGRAVAAVSPGKGGVRLFLNNRIFHGAGKARLRLLAPLFLW